MPWSNQGGGPWGSGGGKGPWGSGPQSSGPNPPDLEELLRRSQDKLRNFLPGGNLGSRGFGIIAIIVFLLWVASGIFVVQPQELGVVLRFGQYVRLAQPGPNYHLPYPIEAARTQSLQNNNLDIGVRTEDGRGSQISRDVPEESLMLTGDGNIVDVNFFVIWSVKPDGVGDFLFNIQDPVGTVKAVAESAIREVIGRSNIQAIITGARQTIERDSQDLMQKTLDRYSAGVLVQQVQMKKAVAPQPVIGSFFDVRAAETDRERAQNEAQTYANRVVPEARGKAAQVLQSAEAYRQQTVAEATGQTSRFLKVYEEYKKAPQVTRQRIYLETMEKLFGNTDKIIVDPGTGQGGTGVVPYLPLNELSRRPQTGGGQ